MKNLFEDSGLILILGKVVDCEPFWASGRSSSEMVAQYFHLHSIWENLTE